MEDVADGRIFRRRIVRGARFGFVVACVVAAAVAEVPPSTPSLNDGGDCSGEFIVFDTEWCIPLSLESWAKSLGAADLLTPYRS